MIKHIQQCLKSARFNRYEIAGSLGDMGTFLPLLLAMSLTNGLDFSSSLFFAGLFNVVTGMLFSVPMAVQPMKAIAAIALSQQLTVEQILAAGMIVSFVVFILGVTGLITKLSDLIPKSVIRGIQLALGLSLMVKGAGMMENYGLAFFAALIVLGATRFKRAPSALILFAIGLFIIWWQNPETFHLLEFQWVLPRFTMLKTDDFISTFSQVALPQIPLTLLNSVIAVCALSLDLFPGREVTQRKVATSVGMMNLIGGWFGAMPMCHGAGGMSGQYRFGARTNGSILFLGLIKMTAAFLFGFSLMGVLRVFPISILGVMVIFSGFGLLEVCKDQKHPKEFVVMAAVAVSYFALNNMGLAFAVGMILAMLLKFLPVVSSKIS